MKNLTLIFSSFLIVLNSYAALEPDLRKGVDLTITNRVSYSLLNQLVDNATVFNTGSLTNNKGIVMRSTTRPDIINNPRMTNWLWLDVSIIPNGLGTLKQYLCCGDSGTNWVQAGIGVGSILTANIADYSITATKMASNSVSAYTITEASISGNKIADFGVVAGKLAPGAITNGAFALGAIQSGDIGAGVITNGHLAANTITSNKMAQASITSFNVLDQTLNSNDIAYGGIQATNVANGVITSLEIKANTITSNNMALGSGVNYVNLDTNLSHCLPVAWGIYHNYGPSFSRYHGVSSVQSNALGVYKINWSPARATSSNYAVFVTCNNNNSPTLVRNAFTFSNTTASTWIAVVDNAGAAANPTSFSFMVMEYQ